MITTKIILAQAIARAARQAIRRARVMTRVLRVRAGRAPTVCIIDDAGRTLAILAVTAADLVAGHRLVVFCEGHVVRAGVPAATVVDDTSGALAPLMLRAGLLDGAVGGFRSLSWGISCPTTIGDEATAILDIEAPDAGDDVRQLLADLHRGFARRLPAPPATIIPTPETTP